MNQNDTIQPAPPELVRRYTIIFFISTLVGGVMVFLAVAGRRQALMDQEKARKDAAQTESGVTPTDPNAPH